MYYFVIKRKKKIKETRNHRSSKLESVSLSSATLTPHLTDYKSERIRLQIRSRVGTLVPSDGTAAYCLGMCLCPSEAEGELVEPFVVQIS